MEAFRLTFCNFLFFPAKRKGNGLDTKSALKFNVQNFPRCIFFIMCITIHQGEKKRFWNTTHVKVAVPMNNVRNPAIATLNQHRGWEIQNKQSLLCVFRRESLIYKANEKEIKTTSGTKFPLLHSISKKSLLHFNLKHLFQWTRAPAFSWAGQGWLLSSLQWVHHIHSQRTAHLLAFSHPVPAEAIVKTLATEFILEAIAIYVWTWLSELNLSSCPS